MPHEGITVTATRAQSTHRSSIIPFAFIGTCIPSYSNLMKRKIEPRTSTHQASHGPATLLTVTNAVTCSISLTPRERIGRLSLATLDIDTSLWVLLDLLLEARLNGLDDLLIPLRAHEADGDTLGTETTGTTDTVEVCVGSRGQRILRERVDFLRCGFWHVVVDGQVDALNVDTTAEHVRADADTLVVVLELGVSLDTEMKSVKAQGVGE